MLLHPLACGLLGAIGLGAARGPAEAQRLIAYLKMERIPHEGAWFAPTYRSRDLFPGAAADARTGRPAAYSAIYGLATAQDFSALHRLTSDELWHFYGGDALEMLLLHPEGHGETIVLGPDVLGGQRPQFLVPRGVWQGSRPLGPDGRAYTLFGATLTPGFEASDYEPGYREELQGRYPKFVAQIASLTRADSIRRPGAVPSQ